MKEQLIEALKLYKKRKYKNYETIIIKTDYKTMKEVWDSMSKLDPDYFIKCAEEVSKKQ